MGEAQPIARHFCGQTQPHAAHVWTTPQVYGTATFVSDFQCAGLAVPATCRKHGEPGWGPMNHCDYCRDEGRREAEE